MGVLKPLIEPGTPKKRLGSGETFIDDTFSASRRGAVRWLQHAAVKDKVMALADAMVFLSRGVQVLGCMKPGLLDSLSNSALWQWRLNA